MMKIELKIKPTVEVQVFYVHAHCETKASEGLTRVGSAFKQSHQTKAWVSSLEVRSAEWAALPVSLPAP